GRILDLVNRGHLSLKGVTCVVLDEVDRMFDIGFRDDVKRILKHCPKERSTVVVSATFTEEIERLARQHMTDPEKIVTTSGSLTVSQVAQHYLTVRAWDKKRLLHHLLTHEDPALTIVFCRLKKTVDLLAKFLNEKGIEAHAMHGDMRQGKRNTVMKAFKSGKLAVLIASDLASRGIDVEGITHVINYDLPEDPDLYVHRIGRTARAGKDGVAWSLVTPEQGKLLTQIELLIDAEIPLLDYDDFKHRDEPPGHWKPDQPVAPTIDVKVQSRYEINVPKKVNETKFPGGIVPSKLPPKRMHGRVSTGRTKKIEE
ncbi:MAG: DEAD/DEAH box helicase, partial [Phycisphaerales bacterium]|nr:DEAD/DEAH box helicase [Phycisphaerales bacterium]